MTNFENHTKLKVSNENKFVDLKIDKKLLNILQNNKSCFHADIFGLIYQFLFDRDNNFTFKESVFDRFTDKEKNSYLKTIFKEANNIIIYDDKLEKILNENRFRKKLSEFDAKTDKISDREELTQLTFELLDDFIEIFNFLKRLKNGLPFELCKIIMNESDGLRTTVVDFSFFKNSDTIIIIDHYYTKDLKSFYMATEVKFGDNFNELQLKFSDDYQRYFSKNSGRIDMTFDLNSRSNNVDDIQFREIYVKNIFDFLSDIVVIIDTMMNSKREVKIKEKFVKDFEEDKNINNHSSKSSKKKKKKQKTSANIRRSNIYQITNNELDSSGLKNKRRYLIYYHKASWNRRGFYRTTKTGKVVYVKPTTCQRRKDLLDNDHYGSNKPQTIYKA
jgi:hypothetical protein